MPVWLIYVWNFLQALPSLIKIFHAVDGDVTNGTVPPVATPSPVVAGTIPSALPAPPTHQAVLAQVLQNYKDSPRAR